MMSRHEERSPEPQLPSAAIEPGGGRSDISLGGTLLLLVFRRDESMHQSLLT